MVWPFVIIFLLAAGLLFVRVMRTVGRKPWFKTTVFLVILLLLSIVVAAILFPPKKIAPSHLHGNATNPLSIRR
jgi:hypothetical protein